LSKNKIQNKKIEKLQSVWKEKKNKDKKKIKIQFTVVEELEFIGGMGLNLGGGLITLGLPIISSMDERARPSKCEKSLIGLSIGSDFSRISCCLLATNVF
jgi:hypothetical protein